MKTKFSLLLVATMLAFWPISARAIPVFTEELISLSDFNSDLAFGALSWHGLFQAGGTSGVNNSHEMAMTIGVASPITAEHTWTWPETVSLDYDLAGNLTISAGGVTSILDQPVQGFDTLLLHVRDNGTLFGGSSITGGSLSGTAFSDLIVDESDVYMRLTFAELSPAFNLSGLFGTDPLTAGANGALFEVYALDLYGGSSGSGGGGTNNSSVPDAGNTLLLTGFSLLGLLAAVRFKKN